jgi:hypothetical protein
MSAWDLCDGLRHELLSKCMHADFSTIKVQLQTDMEVCDEQLFDIPLSRSAEHQSYIIYYWRDNV